LAADATQRLEIGTGIAVAFPRSPMVVAQAAWDLAEQSRGRFILGLGTQIKPHIVRRFSTIWDSPGPRLREYILALRAIWNTFQSNAPLKFEGDYYQFSLMTPFFSPGPIPTPSIPIYIAGVNAYLCKLAGELCQGFHVHPFHTPRYLRDLILPNITQGAQDAGRTRADVALTCAIFVVTGKDQQEIDNSAFMVKSQIAFYASTPSYLPVLEVHGWQGIHDNLNALSRRGQWAEMAAQISDEMLHQFAVVAPHQQLARRVRERYEGLLDRVSYYFPFDPNGDQALWRDAIAVLSA
jgi:probable F420-dependent oxidoreductase